MSQKQKDTKNLPTTTKPSVIEFCNKTFFHHLKENHTEFLEKLRYCPTISKEFTKLMVHLRTMANHGTVIPTGKTREKIYCYLRD